MGTFSAIAILVYQETPQVDLHPVNFPASFAGQLHQAAVGVGTCRTCRTLPPRRKAVCLSPGNLPGRGDWGTRKTPSDQQIPKQKSIHVMVYLPTWMVDFIVNVGSYASPMDPMRRQKSQAPSFFQKKHWEKKTVYICDLKWSPKWRSLGTPE